MSHDALLQLLSSLAFILVAAKIGGHLAILLKQPPVLGELVFGIALGNLGWVSATPGLEMLAELGVILLLFDVGLHTSVQEMKRVGLSAFLVATLGVIAPMVLGFGVAKWLLPDQSIYVHLFIGATLCATSVGITARVLSDLNKLNTDEAKIVLGAAAIDDVLGLIILATVSGIIISADQGTAISWASIAWIILKALLFFVVAGVMGWIFSKSVLPVGARIKGKGVLLGFAMAICFLFSYLAALGGLAPIVGAFAAGLVLEEVHFQGYEEKVENSLAGLLAPVLYFLVPIFFVVMGLRVDLSTFMQTSTLGLAALLTLAAIIGKQVCSLGVVGQQVSRLAVGFGMIPRGEVGLIFANIGLTLVIKGERVISSSVFSAVVFMVVVTTLVAPPLLSWALTRNSPAK